MTKATMRQFLWAAALAACLAGSSAAAPVRQVTRLAGIPPAKPGTIDVGYDLSFWFIPFGHTDYHAAFDNGAYHAKSYFKTSGLVSVFWQSEIDASAEGKIGEHRVMPSVYDSYARRSAEKKQQVKLTFETDRPPVLFAQPAYDTKTYPVPEKEQAEGIDPMSAIALILSGVTADAKNPCGTVAPVFDGRRRYNIELGYLRDQKVKLDEHWDGTVHVCTIQYHQIAGYKPNVLRGEEKWPPIYALIADIPDPSAPLGRYTVPLKLWSKTEWGTVTALVSSLKTGGNPVKG